MQSTMQPVILAIMGLAGFLFWFFIIRMIVKHKKEKKQLKSEISVIKHSMAEMPYKISSNNGWWGVTNSEIVADEIHIPFSEIDSVGMNFPKRKISYTVKDTKRFKPGSLDFDEKEFNTAAQAYLFIIQHTSDENRLQRAKREISLYQGKEIRVKCNVCGKFFCYNYQDLIKNNTLKQNEALEAIGAVASSLAVSCRSRKRGICSAQNLLIPRKQRAVPFTSVLEYSRSRKRRCKTCPQ